MTEQHYKNGERVSENWDSVFRSLSAEPRRQLLVSLLDAGPDQSVPLPESAAMPNVPSDPGSLRTELYHHHLPMLAEAGFITWETDPLAASRGPEFEQVAAVFEAVFSSSTDLPESLTLGCQRLEREQQDRIDLG